jgi:ribulose-5-phosphate 4-epimerase/fuculose-1-phosphate aldolase
MSNESKLREEIVDIGQSLFQRGLTFGSSGNISVRLDDGWLLTPTNSCLGKLEPARISKLTDEGELISGDKPSKEAFLHSAVYQERGIAKAVVHLHSTYSVAVSCLADADPENCIPPITAYYVMKIGKLPLVPYYRPGDPKLGDAVRDLFGSHTAVLLANHGPVVAGTSLEAALYATEELEETAKLHLLLRGSPVRCLTGAQVDELKRAFAKQ